MATRTRLPSPSSQPSDDGDPSGELSRALGAERILAQISASVKDFAIIVLTPDGRIAHWNEGAQRLFGYTSNDILGQFGRVIFTREDREKGRAEDELRTGRVEGRADDDCYLERKDGSRFWASGVLTSVRGTEGQLEGFVKILRDQTARKALEDELRRVNTTLEERVRERTADLEDAVKEMAAFSYSIAHDLKAPLRSMAGFAQLLDQDYSNCLGETGRDYASRIAGAARTMQQMIDDLLTYSQLTHSEILCHPLDPGAMLDQVLGALASQIRDANAEIRVERPLPQALAQEITLGQVFTNLISNAIKFVAPGIQPKIRIFGEVRKDWVRLWVEDNGIGVPPEYRQKVFGIFERLNPSAYPGTGIGLAIVHRAMDRMKGHVGVEPVASGTGSRFWIDLRKVAG